MAKSNKRPSALAFQLGIEEITDEKIVVHILRHGREAERMILLLGPERNEVDILMDALLEYSSQ